MQSRQARETGICNIREELFSQCFDELIRQITINCAERGFLLTRVRDEIKMTINAYQTLYESSIAYGMRKALMAEQGKNEMNTNIKQLIEACDDNAEEIKKLEAEIERKILEDEKQRQSEQKQHEEQVKYLNELNADYKEELETLLSTPAKWNGPTKDNKCNRNQSETQSNQLCLFVPDHPCNLLFCCALTDHSRRRD